MVAARLCLNMIVKNEAHVIERCLRAARPHIDRWCIVDTGSTDGTQQRIRELLADLPGELHERPWVNFAHNRTEALELAKPGGGLALFLDADDVLSVDAGAPKPFADVNAQYLTIHVGESFSFSRVGIIDLTRRWRWEGVLHEYLECADPSNPQLLPGWHVRSLSDSARNREGSKKYLRDAVVLEAALVDDPTNARYTFYLAQSYRDGKRPDRALPFYAQRATMGGFEEEAWFALYQVAVMQEALGKPDAALDGYLRAYDRRPTRAEPLHAAARLCRQLKRWGSANVLARTAMMLPRPNDVLFLDDSVYTWRSHDEYAVSSYWLGLHDEGIRVCDQILARTDVPEADRARTVANRDFCLSKRRGGA
jgi:glycosyltransferase involved in cell wall biosynthesis